MAGFLTFSLIRGSGNNGSADPGTEIVANAGDGGSAVTFSGKTYDELSYMNVCNIINTYNENNRQYDYVDGEVEYEEAITDEAAGAASESNDAGGDRIQFKSETTGSTAQKTDDYSRTDTQVAGVDEGDIVKTDGKYIYTIENSTFGFLIHIIEPNGNNSREIGSIEIPSSSISEMYVAENSLITIGNNWDNGKSKTIINFVDISDAAHPTICHTLTQTGGFNTSRLSGGYLYTFSEDEYYNYEAYSIDRPQDYVPQINDEVVPAGKIVRAGTDDTNNYMVMTSVPVTGDDSFTDTLAVLGGGATYYVGTEHIYIARYTGYSSSWFGFGSDYTPTTSLTKFTYFNGIFEKNTSTSFRGQIADSYYMHEFKDSFCFVYTSNDSSGQSVNGLCVVDEDLNKMGELRNIAPGERIYSSYFIDNMAYFVTYRNTDPVFAVDISNPRNPVLKSELKLPGFSSYLHSFGTDQLIGIGYGAPEDGDWDNTTKLSLFGIGNNYEITELTKEFADQYSQNIAGNNHKAVFVDEDRMIVGLGLECYNYYEVDDGTGDVGTPRNIQYYVAYQLKGNKFVKVLDTSNDKTIGDLNYRESRGVRIGDTFYVCNTTGVKKAYTISADGSKWKEA